MAAVGIEGVRHHFGGLAVLDGVDVDVPDGGFVALVGPSGCGKSTLLKMLSGLVRPSEGRLTVGGVDVVGRTGHVALHPQRDVLLPWRRTMANATLGAEVCGVPREQARAQASELLERFGLDGFERAWPSQLSGGMRQRLALLRTFLVPRPVLLLDEPFGALDALTRRDLQTWLASVWVRDRRTTLLVTHDVEEALLLAHRVVVMSPRPGRVVHTEQVDAPVPRPPGWLLGADAVAAKQRVLTALGAT